MCKSQPWKEKEERYVATSLSGNRKSRCNSLMSQSLKYTCMRFIPIEKEKKSLHKVSLYKNLKKHLRFGNAMRLTITNFKLPVMKKKSLFSQSTLRYHSYCAVGNTPRQSGNFFLQTANSRATDLYPFCHTI